MNVLSWLTALLAIVGAPWVIAVVGAALASLFEASRSEKGETGAMHTASALLSVITPFLLFVHAFMQIAGALGLYGNMGGLGDVVQSTLAFGLYIIMGALLFGPILPALAIRSVAPGLGRTLFAISPWVHVAVFVLALVTSFNSVLAALALFGLQFR